MFQFVQGAGAHVNVNDQASASVQLTGVQAGHLIVVGVKWSIGDVTCTVSDGTSSFTARARIGTTTYAQQFYLLASVASGTVTYTATFSGALADHPSITVQEFSYTGTAAFDAAPANDGAAGLNSSANSGTLSTTGTDELVVGFAASASDALVDTEAIGGVAATANAAHTDDVSQFFRILTEAASNIAATATVAWTNWACGALSFKATAAAASSTLPDLPLLGVG